MVGAVIVKDGEVLAESWHEAPGRMHAEPSAIAALRVPAAGASMYVNLEPCCHWGRTPPCTDAILRSGVRTIVAGMVDPNPVVQGKGLKRLRDAGLEVIVGVEESLCRELNGGFIKATVDGLPRVSEISLDPGEELGAASSRSLWELSDRVDAILVDLESLPAWDALARAFAPGAPARAKVVRIREEARRGEPRRLLEDLCRRGIHDVLVWGGTSLAASLRDADLVDRSIHVTASGYGDRPMPRPAVDQGYGERP